MDDIIATWFWLKGYQKEFNVPFGSKSICIFNAAVNAHKTARKLDDVRNKDKEMMLKENKPIQQILVHKKDTSIGGVGYMLYKFRDTHYLYRKVN